MSVAIGLHHEEESAGLSSLEREMRRRTWHACLQMELIMSMTMGRPVQLGVEHNVPLPLAIDDEYLSPTRCDCRQPDSIVSRNQYLVESLKLVQVLSQVLSTMYNATRDEEQKVSTGVPNSTMRAKLMDMLQIEASLDNFESSLHPSLKWGAYCSSMAANDVFVRQSNVLHARILHLKLLLHRPALSLYCSPKGNSGPSSEITSGLNRFPNPYPADSAVACVKAACGLIDVIHRAVASGSASAWWYCVFYLISGSLVLALAESRDELVARLEANTLESAWSKCDQALCRMAKLVDGPVQDYATALRELRRRATERDRQQPEASQQENRQSVTEQAPTNQFESTGKTALQYETLHMKSVKTITSPQYYPPVNLIIMKRNVRKVDPDGDTLLILHNPDAPFAVIDSAAFWHLLPTRIPPTKMAELQLRSSERSLREPQIQQNKEELRLRLSSTHLTFASAYFKAMMTNDWKETRPEDGYSFVVTTEEWDQEALLILMNIIHGQTTKIPRIISIEMLAKMAVLVDYYKCHEAVEFYAKTWINNLIEPLPTFYGRNFLLRLCISWVFSESEVFRELTRAALYQSRGPIHSLGLPIPGDVIGM
ncbi:hypothetical protein Trisim1_001857 [Trichoderma cf. simile WF8]